MNYPYETVDYSGRLQFKDAFGLEAYFHCYQRLRVLAPELFTVVRRFWGDGDQLHDFVSPSAASIQVVGDADPKALLLVLQKPALRGDEIEIHSIRRIHHGFRSERPYWEFMAFTPTERAKVAIDFPVAREPEGIEVSASPGARSPYVKRSGTKELLVTVSAPEPGSLYRAEWSW
jgi:hypothetical protein